MKEKNVERMKSEAQAREEEVKGKATIRELVRQIDPDVQCEIQHTQDSGDPDVFSGWIVSLSKGEYKNSIRIIEEDLEDVDTDLEVSDEVRKKIKPVIIRLCPDPKRIGF